jgi:hypothetical protein
MAGMGSHCLGYFRTLQLSSVCGSLSDRMYRKQVAHYSSLALTAFCIALILTLIQP